MKTVVDLTTSLKTYLLGKDTAAKQAVEGNIATVETDATSSSKGYSEGEQLFLNDVLYDVTATITAGDALAVGTNIDVASKISASISGKQDQIEVSTMPTASAAYLGKVLIFIGTTGTYTSGQSYQCIYDNGSYSWQPVGGGSVSAANVTYDNTQSGMTADDVQEAVDELNQALTNVTPTILTQTLTAGSTSLTFTNAAIGNNSHVRPFSNPTIIGLIEDATQSGTSITLTCKEQSSDVSISLEIYTFS